jgi:hypothetical protein
MFIKGGKFLDSLSDYYIPKKNSGLWSQIYSDYFYSVNRFHDSAPHGDRCTAGCEAHTTSADESACLTADNIRNEVAAIHRLQEMPQMLSIYM